MTASFTVTEHSPLQEGESVLLVDNAEHRFLLVLGRGRQFHSHQGMLRHEEIIGQPMTRLLPPGLEDEEDRILERLRRGERIEHFETRRRRKDGIPLLEAKFRTNLARKFAEKQRTAIYNLCKNQKLLEATPVHEFVDRFAL